MYLHIRHAVSWAKPLGIECVLFFWGGGEYHIWSLCSIVGGGTGANTSLLAPHSVLLLMLKCKYSEQLSLELPLSYTNSEKGTLELPLVYCFARLNTYAVFRISVQYGPPKNCSVLHGFWTKWAKWCARTLISMSILTYRGSRNCFWIWPI